MAGAVSLIEVFCSLRCERRRGGPDLTAQATPPLDWEVYRRFKAEGQINFLLRLSDPLAMKVSGVLRPGDTTPSNIILFVSRGEQLLWRKDWTQGRFVKLSWPPEQRAALLRQDAIFREADAGWEKRHGRVDGCAVVLQFVQSRAQALKW